MKTIFKDFHDKYPKAGYPHAWEHGTVIERLIGTFRDLWYYEVTDEDVEFFQKEGAESFLRSYAKEERFLKERTGRTLPIFPLSECCQAHAKEDFKDNPRDHHDSEAIYTCEKCGQECGYYTRYDGGVN